MSLSRKAFLCYCRIAEMDLPHCEKDHFNNSYSSVGEKLRKMLTSFQYRAAIFFLE